NVFREHPLNLNTASREDLESLVLLNDLQVQALLDHIARYGKLLSLEELQTIDGFDPKTIFIILPFIKVNEQEEIRKVSLKEMLEKGKSALFIRYQQVLQEQKGYSPADTSTGDTHRYNGNASKIYSRYRDRKSVV